MAENSNVATKGRVEAAQPEQTRGGNYFFTPRVDIYETDPELTLYAEVPGARPEDVDLHYEQGELVLRARVRPRAEGKRLLLQEYEEGDFYRAFNIHESIDPSRINAEVKNGVLIVHLPKAEAAKPRQISIKAS